MKTWKTLAAAVLLGTAVICAGTDSPWGIAAHPHAAKEWENIDRQLEPNRTDEMAYASFVFLCLKNSLMRS